MKTLAAILADHASGACAIRDTVAAAYAHLRAHDDPAMFIALRPEADALAEADRLQAEGRRGRRLWGALVAVKDNIDVAGLPTTAACPAYAYQPADDSAVVARLRAEGAIVMGKTNLDQFATGLNGSRSPYGVPRNTLNAGLAPGGSSSGSACAVAAGVAPIALGTDTAGSGRVPAGLQNIVGLKPSLGLLPTTGVVPACRTLDCVSVFALTVEDAWLALEVMAGPDAGDPFSRAMPLGALAGPPPAIRIAVPNAADLDFGGDAGAERSFSEAVARLEALGIAAAPIDMTPFREAARLLYDGPWVAERWLTIADLLARDADAILPVIRQVISGRPLPDAAQTFAARYRLAELAQAARAAMAGFDALMVPTFPRPATLAELAADPVGANSRLGAYTNFVNLLDMCALAVPASLDAAGIAAGVTFIAAAGRDAALAAVGRIFHAAAGLPLGATGLPMPPTPPLPTTAPPGTIELAVVGAHLSGMPLNAELTTRGASFVREAETAPDYRLFALPGGPPFRPGLVRVAAGEGGPIKVEVWALPSASFGEFVAAIPSPLGIGALTLADGTRPKGFLCEAIATAGAADVTGFGGWRAYVASLTKAPG